MNHIMVDLETLDTGTDAVVLSIGAVAFDPVTMELGTSFYVELNDNAVVTSQVVEASRTISKDTVVWWKDQSFEAQKLMREGFGNRVETLEDGLTQFREFVELQGDHKETKVWGNGAAFDNVILRNLYNAVGLEAPWKFYNDRCFRTMKSLDPNKALRPEFKGIPHYALDDAIHQTEHLLEIFKCLEPTQLSV